MLRFLGVSSRFSGLYMGLCRAQPIGMPIVPRERSTLFPSRSRLAQLSALVGDRLMADSTQSDPRSPECRAAPVGVPPLVREHARPGIHERRSTSHSLGS